MHPVRLPWTVQPKLHHLRFYRRQFQHLLAADALARHSTQAGSTRLAYFWSALNDDRWFLSPKADTQMTRLSATLFTDAFFTLLLVAHRGGKNLSRPFWVKPILLVNLE